MSIVSTCRSTIRPALLPRQLHDERHRGEVLDVPRGDGPALVADVEADAVVGDDDNERVRVQAESAQSRDELAEQPVGQPELEQVPLVRDLHQPRDAEPDHVVEPGDRLGREAPVARVPEG